MTLQRGETVVILKQVPADVCDNCGEYYLSSEVTAQVLEKAEAAVKSGAEVEILRFAARRAWLGRRDSNPDTQIQSLQSYR